MFLSVFPKVFSYKVFLWFFPGVVVGPTTLNLDVHVLFVFGPPACFLFLFSVGVVCVGLYVSKNVQRVHNRPETSENVQRVHNRPETQSVLCKGVGACYGQFREYV